jgi:hypothetical protein
MNKVKEPTIKAGEIRKDYDGCLNEVLVVSNDFNEVSQYDFHGECEYELAESESVPGDCLFIAARKISTAICYVYPTSRNSEILGE